MLSKISAVIPAHNEEGRIGLVLNVLVSAKLFAEIIVVDDASSDNTSTEVKNNFPTVRLIKKKKTNGKADAMILGAKKAINDVLFFCDADLINLKKQHLMQLITPVLSGELRMSIGVQEYIAPFKGDKNYKKFKAWFNNFGGGGRPYLNEYVKGMGGERVLFKKDFLKIKSLKGSHYGVEQELNLHFLKNNLKFRYFVLKDVSHFSKIEKWGYLKGIIKEFNYLRIAVYYLFARLIIKLKKTIDK